MGGSNNIINLGNGTDVVNAGNGETINLGNGSDTVTAVNSTITAGNGNDTVNAGGAIKITLGNGSDTVTVGVGEHGEGRQWQRHDHCWGNSTITVGNGSDTIHVGMGDIVTVGKGHDTFVFDQTTAGLIGAVTINHFDPAKDVITVFKSVTTSVIYKDNAQGNAVITVDGSGTQITLIGVHCLPYTRATFSSCEPL